MCVLELNECYEKTRTWTVRAFLRLKNSSFTPASSRGNSSRLKQTWSWVKIIWLSRSKWRVIFKRNMKTVWLNSKPLQCNWNRPGDWHNCRSSQNFVPLLGPENVQRQREETVCCWQCIPEAKVHNASQVTASWCTFNLLLNWKWMFQLWQTAAGSQG